MEKPVVFIVDDDESVCRALKRLMKSVGLDVRVFTSAKDFLDQGCQNGPRCLILDVRMPGIDGLELQEKLRASGSQMPIIFITAHEDDKAHERATRMGAVAFIQKPFEDQVLLDAIYSALPKSSEGEMSPDCRINDTNIGNG